MIEWLNNLSEGDAKLLEGFLAAQLGYMKGLKPVVTGLKSSKYWIDKFAAQYPIEQAKYFNNWEKDADAYWAYFDGYRMRILGAAAKVDPKWHAEGLRVARHRISLGPWVLSARFKGQGNRSALHEFMFAGYLAWFMKEHGPEADLVKWAVDFWNYWLSGGIGNAERTVTHILWHTILFLEGMKGITTLPRSDEVLTWAYAKLAAQYDADPNWLCWTVVLINVVWARRVHRRDRSGLRSTKSYCAMTQKSPFQLLY